MPLPASSGPISSSQVGVYVFDRQATDEFSLSASLASPGNVNKAYATTIGPLWIGDGVSDINNPQYDSIAPWSLSDWYGYWKGIKANITEEYRPDNPDGACADNTEFALIYYTDGRYYNAGAGSEQDVYNNSTVVYTNGEGNSPYLVASANNYFKIIELNTAYSTDGNGVLINEYIC